MLTDIRTDYQLTTSSGTMKVVGHVDQMHASRCYQQNENMTCTMCHDMHATEADQPKARFFRQNCLTCHTVDGCGPTATQRAIREPGDNCTKCHMPQVPTAIPHIAFTHHRIGIHRETDSESELTPSEGRLVPFGNVSHLSDTEQQRYLALAYAELADKQKDPELAKGYRAKSFQLMKELETRCYAKGDGDLLAMLARFAWESEQPAVAAQYANEAMASPDVSVGPRVNSLLVAGDSFLQLRRSPESLPYFEKLVQLRRRSQDWYLLGIAQYQSGQKAAGIKSIEHAGEIQPFRVDLHQTLSEMLEVAGRPIEAASHQNQALRLGSTT